jgi:GTPase SAR1 family protein
LNKLKGIKIKDNIINQRVLINLLQYYLILNEYYIYNDNIYIKIKESKISYLLVGTIKYILYDKFQENVVKFYLLHLNNYFDGFDFSYLMDNYFIKTKNIIESIKDISTQRIDPDFGLIEFTDGVYSIKYDRFFLNKDNYNYSNKISTLKYYNKTYNWVRQNKPINWIGGLKNALGITDGELTNSDYIRLCLHIINPIHKNIFNKKSTLFIHGQSNTGKTTLIANVLSEYFGSDNIGSVISAKNFKWQDLVGKILGIIDEGRYNSSMSADLLKITGQERIIVEKKYSKEHIIINPIPLIILTNLLFEDKDIFIDEALKNRLYIIEFISKISNDSLNNSKGFKGKLKSEEASIIVYCNKLLFKLRYGNLKRIGNTISNHEVLKLIEFKKN